MRGLGRLSGYQRLGLVMLVGLLALIALGGTVRVTDSGLACPDWPLCNGALIPGGDYRVWIEWTHRLVASLVGVVIVAFVVGAILRHRQRRWVVAPAVAGVVALGVQVVLGGLTVTEELAAGLVSAHLATALIIVVLLLTAWLATFVPAGGPAPGRARGGAERQLAELCVVAAVGLFAVMVLGSYVSGTEAGFFCAGDWPLCNGSLLPEGRLPGLQVAHRYLVVFEGLLIAGMWLPGLAAAGPGAVGLAPGQPRGGALWGPGPDRRGADVDHAGGLEPGVAPVHRRRHLGGAGGAGGGGGLPGRRAAAAAGGAGASDAELAALAGERVR